MKVFTALCMVALALGHPIKEAKNSGHVDVKSDGNEMANEHMTHKRSIQTDEETIVKEDHKNINENIIQKRDVQDAADHVIQKRDIQSSDDTSQNDCSQTSGDVSQNCAEQNIDDSIIQKRDVQNIDDRVIQKRDAQSVDNKAYQDDNVQEAYSNEGGYAKQGEGGQYIYASDFGGPMVQILQHVYKANCCACGCDCGCEGEETPAGGDGTTVDDGTTE